MYADHAPDSHPLELRRARLMVKQEDVARYTSLVQAINALPSGPIWAGPDAPEVAFLTARRDLNNSFFTFLGPSDDSSATFGPAMAERGAIAVVVDSSPAFSVRLSSRAIASLDALFPHVTTVDYFQVHARESRP
jgi:hypothetical protein